MNRGIIACPEPLAAEAGAKILRRGGNAADAAAATALAQGVANPMMTGIGGSATFVYVDGTTGEAIYVAANGCAPSRTHETMWTDHYTGRDGTTWRLSNDANLLGYEASLVPGNLRGLEILHKRFGSGRIPWADIVTPAIEIAENGYDVEAWQWEMWRPGGRIGTVYGFGDPLPLFTHTPAAAAIYAPSGRQLQVGERLVQKAYGRTLRRIAEEGVDVFYKGDIARQIVEDFETHGGTITFEDLSTYEAPVHPAFQGSFHEYTIYGSQAPALGPVTQLMLNVLEGYDLVSMGRNSAQYADLLSRIMQLAYAERYRHMADPAVFDVPLEKFASKDFAKELRQLIVEGKDEEQVLATASDSGNTTAMVAMDTMGNTIALVQSINVGSGVVTDGLGFLYNSHMWMFDPRPGRRNSIAPGRVPIGGSSATVATLGKKPILALSSPSGSRGTSACLQVLLDVLVFDKSIQEAIDAPRIHSEDRVGEVGLEPHSPRDLEEALHRLGRNVVRGWHYGTVSGIHRDLERGTTHGGTDPRMGAGLAIV